MELLTNDLLDDLGELVIKMGGQVQPVKCLQKQGSQQYFVIN